MKRKLLNSFTISLCLTLISFFVYRADLTLFELFELKSYDYQGSHARDSSRLGSGGLVAADEKSLKEEGRCGRSLAPSWLNWLAA